MPAEIVRIFDSDDYDQYIQRAAALIGGGGVVALPTETIYGGAALLTQPAAVARLRQLPPAASSKPMVVHLSKPADAGQYLDPVGELAQRMMRKLWPGPVGLVFDVSPPRQREVSAALKVPADQLYDGPSITLRCPDHIVASDVLAQVSGPVVIRKAGDDSTAARPGEIARQWGDSLDMVLDAGPARYSKPSTIIKVTGDHYQIVRTGVYDQRIIERLLRSTLLFVCSGNTCRSAMAEALARCIMAQKLGISQAELESRGITVISAGTFAFPGARAAAPAIEAVKPLGGDLSTHRSRPLSIELIHQADLIYAMSRSHRQTVLAMVPAAADKVFTLDPDDDIEDPIGGDLALYQSLAGQLQTLIAERLDERPLA